MRLSGNILLSLFSFLFCLASIEVALRIFNIAPSPTYRQPVDPTSPVLHFQPNRTRRFTKGHINVEKKVNNYGFFSETDYKVGINDYCVIGDSYVEAMQVRNQDTFHAIFSSNLDKKSVVAIGVSGSPLSQYLLYAEWALDQFACKYIIFIIVENDFDESMLSVKHAPGYRYFNDVKDIYGDEPEVLVDFKPSFATILLRESALVSFLYLNLEVSRLFKGVLQKFTENFLRRQYASDIPNSAQENNRLRKSREAIEIFLRRILEIKPRDTELLFVLDGDRSSIYKSKEQDFFYSGAFGYMKQKLAEKKLKFLELHTIFAEDFQKNKKHFNFSNDYHWDEYGHRLVGQALTDYFASDQKLQFGQAERRLRE